MDRQFDLRCLRLRMGWTSSDLARRLGVQASEIEIWETGSAPKDPEILNQIEFLFRQADICCDEVKSAPLAEDILDRDSLGQIESDRIKDTPARG